MTSDHARPAGDVRYWLCIIAFSAWCTGRSCEGPPDGAMIEASERQARGKGKDEN